jgi:hypothetical protein
VVHVTETAAKHWEKYGCRFEVSHEFSVEIIPKRREFAQRHFAPKLGFNHK